MSYSYNFLEDLDYLYEADRVKLIIRDIPTALLNAIEANKTTLNLIPTSFTQKCTNTLPLDDSYLHVQFNIQPNTTDDTC